MSHSSTLAEKENCWFLGASQNRGQGRFAGGEKDAGLKKTAKKNSLPGKRQAIKGRRELSVAPRWRNRGGLRKTGGSVDEFVQASKKGVKKEGKLQ